MTRGQLAGSQWPQEGHTLIEWTPRAHLVPEPNWLSPAEAARAARLVPPLGEQWAAARCWVRARLALRLGCAPAAVPLRTDGRGRLSVAGVARPRDLNVSHTGHVLVLALSGSRVGVDVEEPPPAGEDLLALAEVVGTRREVDQLRELPMTERAAAFQRWWVRKEAVLKADGAGFLTDPRQVHVGIVHSQPPEVWAVLDHGALRHPDEDRTTPHTLLATAHDRRAGTPTTSVRMVSHPSGLR
ncbi:4'-phosphopantetheinyl transferase family protein [Ornithinimicrobium murale]|uniref:4'-phosphopantetheinyl transferase family protein n=1 Tax=Ornithinimicrobium murale TaxID=1050153 RepID=UPI000E0D301B|nr:4'-phosphopantetheinyl transferase superfamily protein [Ornithinimicrobium murale]